MRDDEYVVDRPDLRTRLRRILIGAAAAGLVVAGIFLITDGDEKPSTPAPESAGGSTTAAPTGGSRAVATVGRSVPTKIRIPSIGTRSNLMRLGLQSDGTLEVPPGARPAGWFTGAPTPGEAGPAVIVGHVAWNGLTGVFGSLHDATAGREGPRRPR